jgi:GntR family transcriptional regulator, transcriptional repressor for pyruvate dehydrogenase complex
MARPESAEFNTAPRRRPLQQIRIAESVAAKLRARILASAEGAVLPKQDELVAEFRVSYPSVREALRILETEGLITVRRGNVGGAEILRPDASSAAYSLGLALQASRVRVADLADALVRLEPQCAAMCADRDDHADNIGPLLRQNLGECREMINDYAAFTSKAREFHDIIVTHSGNATMELVVRSLVALWSSQEETWDEAMAMSGETFGPPERQKTLDAHTRIVAKIEVGDAAGAERAARRHIEAVRDVYLSRFGDMEVVDAASARARGSFQSLM